MTPTLRERLVGSAGRFDLFLGLGRRPRRFWGSSCSSARCVGATADRAWHLFQVNWLFFTGLASGSVAFAAVHKITNAKWSGVIIRFAEASVAFLPISLIGLLLIFGAGLPPHLRADAGGAARLQHGKARLALARRDVRPAVHRAAALSPSWDGG